MGVKAIINGLNKAKEKMEVKYLDFKYYESLQYVPKEKQTDAHCRHRIETGLYDEIQYAENQTDELINLAVEKDPRAIQHVRTQYPSVCVHALLRADELVKERPVQYGYLAHIDDKSDYRYPQGIWQYIDPQVYEDVKALYNERVHVSQRHNDTLEEHIDLVNTRIAKDEAYEKSMAEMEPWEEIYGG